MIVGDCHGVLEEHVAITQVRGRLFDDILEPACGLRLPRHRQIPVADHVEEEEPFDPWDQSLGLEARREMPAAVQSVVGRELVDGFLEIRPQQPDLHLHRLMSQRIGKREQNASARAAVVRADEAWLEQRVVVAREDEDRLPRVVPDVEFPDDGPNRHGAARRAGRELVGVDHHAVLLQHAVDQVFRLLVPGRPRRPLAKSRHFGGVGVGLLRVEPRVQIGRLDRRAGAGPGRGRGRWRGLGGAARRQAHAQHDDRDATSLHAPLPHSLRTPREPSGRRAL